LAAAVLLVAAFGCGDDDDDGPIGEQTGQSCANANDCFRNMDGAALQGGEAVCMDRVENGYCTHHCGVDADCCAVPGECATTLPQVCAPFESTGERFCFLSCEAADVSGSGFTDENEFCRFHAHRSFGCRSTGGGSENRKVCVP
jgi:hypothetical protein